ncbi:MAG: hypothetical protein F4Y24_16460 [Gemmatimonadetes bacterium]|nr:hypothetical protein [Gemmatimonadota bacterium]MYG21123.1 hypothetical protein [Gemmatimonadota bacterium]MYJ40181.1 hypothetical protein [Gemmatimonadota bacterium]
MPLGIGIGELLLLGIVAGGVYLGVRSLKRIGGGDRERELEAARRDFEREIEAMNHKERIGGE